MARRSKAQLLDDSIALRRKEIELFDLETRVDRINKYKASSTDTSMTDRRPAYQGASRGNRAVADWFPFRGDPDDEIPGLERLRTRSRDLYKNNTIAAGATKTMVGNTVGSGLTLNSSLDVKILKISDDRAAVIEDSIERLWNRWTEESDAARQLDFYEQQEVAYLSYLISGDGIGIFPRIPFEGSEFKFRLKVIEGDRLSNPNNLYDTKDRKGGIEIGKFDEPVAYHFRSREWLSDKWYRVPARGARTGRRNVLHFFRAERPGARRGTPVLAPIIPNLRQMGRYIDAETMATIISSFYTVFIKSQAPDAWDTGLPGSQSANSEQQKRNYELAPGAVIRLDYDEDITPFDPKRPNTAFESFVQAIMRQIGMALEIPYEILIKHYSSSYSASRGARIDAARVFNARRSWFARKWCQVIYQEWLYDMVVEGLLDLPGFLDSPEMRYAYSRALWTGDTMGMLDPLKETQGARERLDGMLSTHTAETAGLTGQDFETVVRIRAKEKKLLDQYGLKVKDIQPPAPQNPTDPQDGEESTTKGKEEGNDATEEQQ